MSSVLQKASTDYKSYYSRIIRINENDISSKGEASLVCPVHDDTKGSLKINIYDGKWNCFGCGRGGGDPVSFYSFLHRCDAQDSVEELESLFDNNKQVMYDVEGRHRDLLSSQIAIESLLARGIGMDAIRKYRLGYENKRVCLPEFGFGGNLIQVIAHDMLKLFSSDQKSYCYVTGLGVRLWPVENLRKRKIYLFEGWPDAILANFLGLNAVSVTGSGARTWNEKFNKYFKDKEVNICFDIDSAGEGGAKKIAKILSSIASEVNIINLNAANMPEKGDFTNYIQLYGFERFKEIPKIKFKDTVDAGTIVQEITLGESLNAIYFNKPVRTVAVITGKAERFTVPRRVSLTCNMKNSKKCSLCKMMESGGSKISTLNKTDANILKLIRVTDKCVKDFFRAKEKIVKDCPFVRMTVETTYNLEELVVIPEINYNANNASYVSRAIYAITETSFVTSRPYILEAIPIPHPKTQVATMLVYHYEETQDNIDNFKMTEEKAHNLKKFQAEGLAAMREKRKEIYTDYERITKIYGRMPMFYAMDMVFHSVLSFNFRGKQVRRGYVNALVIGDTRTGKSESAEKLMEHFKVGDSTSGENLSFAGLVGGVSQTHGNSWAVSWGLMPLNDRKMLKIDEFHGMPEHEFSKTSETISSGIARIQKIKGESAMARTRLLILANTKSGENMDHFQFGVKAIPPVMGGCNEDIARLDFAYAVSLNDVPSDLINSTSNVSEVFYKSQDCNDLILWAWSRRPEDIIFTKDAETKILEETDKLLDKYHQSIPLVVQGEQAIKVARLAVATACRFFSTDDSFHKVIVKAEHVEMACAFLNYAYCKDAMGYDRYSDMKKSKEAIKDPEQLKKIGLTNFVRDQLLSLEYISVSDIEQAFVCHDRSGARIKLSILLANNALYKYNTSSYRKTPAFIKFLAANDFGEMDYEAIENLDF